MGIGIAVFGNYKTMAKTLPSIVSETMIMVFEAVTIDFVIETLVSEAKTMVATSETMVNASVVVHG